ncbi:MAG: sigma-70 family RNA polymerase sigma factor [Gemmatimonadota bacterium]|nr:sigma-70 family RNA polymerase sigma factor [Gemmatimonadota bacterium]
MSIDWNEIYRGTFPGLVRFLHRKVWDPERARDLAQEVFVRALREAPRDPRAWLFQVAANLARDEARTVLRRRKHLTLLGPDLPGPAPAPDPHQMVERREEQDRLRAVLEKMGDRDREVLELWDAGMDYGEIAARAGLSVGAVGTTLARARKRLVALYEMEEKAHEARG